MYVRRYVREYQSVRNTCTMRVHVCGGGRVALQARDVHGLEIKLVRTRWRVCLCSTSNVCTLYMSVKSICPYLYIRHSNTTIVLGRNSLSIYDQQRNFTTSSYPLRTITWSNYLVGSETHHHHQLHYFCTVSTLGQDRWPAIYEDCTLRELSKNKRVQLNGFYCGQAPEPRPQIGSPKFSTYALSMQPCNGGNKIRL